MANKYKEYTEAFKEWSKETGHGLDRQEMSDLHNNMRRLIQERSKMWDKKKDMFRKETNYGLMDLRHNMTQKHLKDMSSWLRSSEGKKEATRDKSDGAPASTLKLKKKMRGGNKPIKAQDTETHEPKNEGDKTANIDKKANCTECGDVFSSREVLKLHRCDRIDTGSDGGETSTTESANYETQSSDDNELGETEESDQWGVHLNEDGVGMITEDAALIDHEKDTVELPRGINQLYTTQEKQGNAFHIQLPTTGKDQY